MLEKLQAFLGQVSVPVLASVVTSAVVSLSSFLVGSRFAKERSDRAAMRQLYQGIRQELVELKEAIDRGSPKRWTDYPTIHDRYTPPLATMDRSGRLAMLPSRLATGLLELEKESLSAEWTFRDWLKDTAIEPIKSIFNNRVRNPTSSLSGRSYASQSIASWALDGPGATEKLIARLETEELGFGLDTALERNRSHTLFAYAETVAEGSQADLVRAVSDSLFADPTGRETAARLQAVAVKLEAQIKLMTKRISEPQPFWRTVGRAFLDIGDR